MSSYPDHSSTVTGAYLHYRQSILLFDFLSLSLSFLKPSFEIENLVASFLVLPYFYFAIAAYCDLNDTLNNKLNRAMPKLDMCLN